MNSYKTCMQGFLHIELDSTRSNIATNFGILDRTTIIGEQQL
jgi:hypothetical protein